MEKKTRNEEIDIAKGIGILLVVIGHSVSRYSVMHAFIYMFHMPLFFIISGLFIKPLHTNKLRGIFEESRLIAFYILYSIVFLSYDVFFRYLLFHAITIKMVAYNAFKTLVLAGISVLWFLTALFWSKNIVKFMIRQQSQIFKVVAALLLFFIPLLLEYLTENTVIHSVLSIYTIWLPIMRAICAASFVMVGHLLKPVLLERKFKNGMSILIIVVTLAVLIISGVLLYKNGIAYDMHEMKVGRFGGMFWLGIVGFINVYFISKYVNRLRLIKRFFLFLGKNSILIMVFHEYFGMLKYIIYLLYFFRLDNIIGLSTVLLVTVSCLIVLALDRVNQKMVSLFEKAIVSMTKGKA